jgi:hypothetical protein
MTIYCMLILARGNTAHLWKHQWPKTDQFVVTQWCSSISSMQIKQQNSVSGRASRALSEYGNEPCPHPSYTSAPRPGCSTAARIAPHPRPASHPALAPPSSTSRSSSNCRGETEERKERRGRGEERERREVGAKALLHAAVRQPLAPMQHVQHPI